MARKLRPLNLSDLAELPMVCRSCSFWETAGPVERRCGAACDQQVLRSWFVQVTQEWGECGRVITEDDAVLGLVKYAPSVYFPQAFTFASAPDDPRVPLIACIHVEPESRRYGLDKVLLQAALRELALRGERHVQAFGYAGPSTSPDETPMIELEFLTKQGFSVAKPDALYPLMQLELRSLVTITENLESVLETLRLPLRSPRQAPVPGA
jgi:ribosomal protein S18 acetylase RimI-like enzyme